MNRRLNFMNNHVKMLSESRIEPEIFHYQRFFFYINMIHIPNYNLFLPGDDIYEDGFRKLAFDMPAIVY